MAKQDILLPTLLTLAAMALLCGLGFWQLQRLEWKQNLMAQLDAEYEKDAAQVTLRPEDIEGDFDYRRGTLYGSYDFDKQILIGPRVYKNIPGRHVYTPLRLQDGSHILVNRGWVPNDWRFENETAAARALASEGKVTGLLRKDSERNPFTPPNDPLKNAWYFPDVAEIARVKSIDNLRPGIFSLERQETEGDYPIPMTQRPDIPNNHLQYAIFWFAMAGIAFIIYLLRFWGKKNA